MGAKVIFECLLALEEESSLENTNSDGGGIIENAVLLGAPVGCGIGLTSGVSCAIYGHMPEWLRARSVVSGRFINCYSANDWILVLLYRQNSGDLSVAGLQPVNLVDGLANYTELTTASTLQIPPNASVTHDFSAAQTISPHFTHGIENRDVSHLISSLLDYPKALPDILPLLGLE